MSALRPGSSLGHHIWILLAAAHLTVDLSVCSPLIGPAVGLKPQHKAVPGSGPRWQPLWDTPNMLHWRTVSPLARRPLGPVSPPRDGRAGLGSKVRVQRHRTPARRLGQALCKDCDWKYSQAGDSPAPLAEAEAAAAAGGAALSRGGKGDKVRLLRRARRQLKWDSDDKSQEGRTTTVAGFIDWGPTGTDNIDEESKPVPNFTLSTKALSTTTVGSTTPTTTTAVPVRTIPMSTTPQNKKQSTTRTMVTVKPQEDPPGKRV